MKDRILINSNGGDLQKIPDSHGIYVFLDKNNQPLYIGKSIHLRCRIRQHLTAAQNSSREAKIISQAYQISWLETAGEFGALLKEASFIKQQSPLYNRRLRRHQRLLSLQLSASNNYYSVSIHPIAKNYWEGAPNSYGLFRSRHQAIHYLRLIIKQHSLCEYFMDGFKCQRPCFSYQLKKCWGACMGKESVENFNQRVLSILQNLQHQSWPFKGPIAIKEACDKRKITEYHLFYKWCYLESVDCLSKNYSPNQHKLIFDKDCYILLVSHLQKHSHSDQVISNWSEQPLIIDNL